MWVQSRVRLRLARCCERLCGGVVACGCVWLRAPACECARLGVVWYCSVLVCVTMSALFVRGRLAVCVAVRGRRRGRVRATVLVVVWLCCRVCPCLVLH